MDDVSSSDGVFSRSNLFRNEPSVRPFVHPALRALHEEFGESDVWAQAVARIAIDMLDFEIDPSTEHGQALAAQVLRKRLTTAERWTDGTVDEAYQQRLDAETASETEFVYYVDLYGVAIKIGYSANVMKRLSGLRRRPEHVLAVEHGGRALEALRHRQFRDDRIEIAREDFERSQQLLTHIATLREQHGEPLAVLAAAGREKRSA